MEQRAARDGAGGAATPAGSHMLLPTPRAVRERAAMRLRARVAVHMHACTRVYMREHTRLFRDTSDGQTSRDVLAELT